MFLEIHPNETREKRSPLELSLEHKEIEAEEGGISRERNSMDKGGEFHSWMEKLLERCVSQLEATSWMADSSDCFPWRSVSPKLDYSLSDSGCEDPLAGDLVKMAGSELMGLRWSLRFWISNTLPDNADAQGPHLE